MRVCATRLIRHATLTHFAIFAITRHATPLLICAMPLMLAIAPRCAARDIIIAADAAATPCFIMIYAAMTPHFDAGFSTLRRCRAGRRRCHAFAAMPLPPYAITLTPLPPRRHIDARRHYAIFTLYAMPRHAVSMPLSLPDITPTLIRRHDIFAMPRQIFIFADTTPC
jgi:hypothetical protein